MLIVCRGKELESGTGEDSRQEREGQCDAQGAFPWLTEVYYNKEIRE